MSRSLGLNEKFTKRELQDLPGGPVVYNLVLPMQRVWSGQGTEILHAAWFSQKNEIERLQDVDS